MSYVYVFINAIVVALMAMYVIENERRMGELSAKHDRTATNAISQVGFTAVLTKDIKLGPLQAIQYDKVITNIGEGYDVSHGHFKAPVSGLYIISATSCSCANEKIWTEIVINGIKQAAMYGHTYDLASHTVVVSLKQNDQVWVRNFGGLTTVHAGADRYYSSFAGVLIAAS